MFAIARRALEETCIFRSEKEMLCVFSIDYGRIIQNLSETFERHVGQKEQRKEQTMQHTA